MKYFLLVWVGRVLTVLGSRVSSFALTLWVYQQTHSITQFSTGLFLGFVPGLIAGPAAGVLVDRFRRKTILLLADTAALAGVVALVISQSSGHLAVWQIYAVVIVKSICGAFQWPAFAASVRAMVPPQHRGRAGGMTQTGFAVTQILGPAISTSLLNTGGLTQVLFADIFAGAVGILSLAMVKIAELTETASDFKEKKSWRSELLIGWRAISGDHRLVRLLRIATVMYAVQAAASVLLLPLIVASVPPSQHNVAVAAVSTAGGVGLAAGSLVMSIWGGPKRPQLWITAAAVLSGVAVVVASMISQSVVLIGSSFVFSFGFPVVIACSQSVWHEAIEPGLEGRVFSLRRMTVQAGTVAGLVTVGPIATYVCTPLLTARTPASRVLRSIFGSGTEGGSGILLCFLGVTLVATSVIGNVNSMPNNSSATDQQRKLARNRS
ncbi:MFS transporter [Streptomyces sp. NPDC002306]